MRELSLHLLDLAENAAAAVAGAPGARVDIDLSYAETAAGARLCLCVADNGRGMTAGQAQKAQSPFYTTRPARGIGMGLPLCKASALRTGGAFSLESAPGRGTRVTAVFFRDHIDCPRIGALPETLAMIAGGHPDIAFTVSARVDSAAGGVAAAAGRAAWRFTAGPAALRGAAGDFPPGDARAFLSLKKYFTENLTQFLQKGENGMKSLEELAAIRDKMKQTVETRMAAHDATRVAVGMATCGIAAGARDVLNAFTEEVAKSGLHGVLVTQMGCIGLCAYEPVVEVFREGEEKVTYVKMTPEKAARVVAEHLVGGTPVAEYTIASAQ